MLITTRLRRLFCVLTVAHALIPTLIHAQREGFDVPPWAQQSTYWVSMESPMLARMLEQPGFNESAFLLNKYFNYVEDEIISSLRNGTSPRPAQNYRTCMVPNKRYVNSINHVFGLRGLPVPTYDCITEVFGTRLYDDRKPLFFVNDLFNAIRDIKKMQEAQKKYFIENILLKWEAAKKVLAEWDTKPAPPFYPFERSRRKCEISGIGFIRVETYWYMNVGVTNKPSGHKLAKWRRQSMQEYVFVGPGGNNSHAVRQRIPTYKDDVEDGESRENVTTTFRRGSGDSLPTAFYPIFPEENPALLDAMAMADLPVRQSNDALTASGLSILFLPIVLNILPISLFTVVSTKVLLVYMLAGDILTVIPLAIKAIELIVIGSQRFRSVVVRMENDSKGMRNVAAAGQIWTAECRADIDLRVYGATFLLIAIFAAILGIWLEIWARRYVTKREKEVAEELYAKYVRIGEDETYENYAAEMTFRKE